MSIDQRIREGLRATNDGLPTPDVDRALAAVTTGGRPTRRRKLVVGLAAAAAVAAAVTVLVVVPDLVDADGSPTPPGPSPTPTPDRSPAPTPVAADGSIYFAADTRAGGALTDPLTDPAVELHPQPMDIYLSRRGQGVRRIIATDAHERCPAVSPDGSRLAYLEDTTIVMAPLDAEGNPGTPDVRVDLMTQGLYAPDRYQPRNVFGTTCPQWSPDGSRLGYQVTLGLQGSTLYDSLTAEVHAVTPGGEDRVLTSFDTPVWHAEPDFAWSPDGDEVAYTAQDGVWRAPLDGSGPELVWRSPEGEPTQQMPMDDDRPISLAWSSRDELAFSVRGFEPTEPNNPMSGGWETYTLMVVDPRSGEVLLEEAGSALESGVGEDWSPDGSLLVFTGPDGHILLNDRETGSTVRLRPQLEGGRGVAFSAPTWSPDGQGLLVRARDQERGFALVSVARDGSSGEVRTPWTWALDWSSLDDVEWSSR